jgi:cobyrinic acid a,c-diamide synthase
MDTGNFHAMSGFVVSAGGSGHGKTLVSLALCAAFRHGGMRVQPYKCGPDYIDARFYERVAGRPAYNVDLWLDGEQGVRGHVAATRGDAEVLVFEGMMGLFDGDSDGHGSTAAIARALNLPVVLVLDCWASSQTAAAVAHGLRTFDPRLQILGVVLNRVAGDEHERAIRDACAQVELPVLFAIPNATEYAAADRLLGLDPRSVGQRNDAVERLARTIAQQIDLRTAFGSAQPVSGGSNDPGLPRVVTRIAYAADDAFWFTYPETLEALRQAGAETIPFSPLRDTALPEGAQGLWLGGGYPEDFAAELEANGPMRHEIAEAVGSGMPTYAECGGMMYLAQTLRTKAGSFVMAGALRGETSMLQPRLHLGYRVATTLADTPLDRAGQDVRGYEFHYATASLDEPIAAYAYDERPDGVSRPNVLAAFLHRHFLPGDPSIARFASACAAKETP